MIHIDKVLNKVEMRGDIKSLSKEIVMAIGAICKEYERRNLELITPFQILELGAKASLDKETK